MKTTFITSNICIVTENVEGHVYVLEADNIKELLDDWNNSCKYVPANDAKVYFATCNGKVLSTNPNMDFEDCLKLIIETKNKTSINNSSIDFSKLYAEYVLKSEGKADTTEELREYTNKCFDLYEKFGFMDIFLSPYESEQKYNGKRFTVLDRVKEISEDKDGADLENLPMWYIRFEDGDIIPAYPEEICICEQRR